MTQPTYDLLNFRFYEDDGTGESDQTALGTGNNQTLDRQTGTDNRFCVRIELYNDNAKSGVETWNWEYSYDGGAWTAISTTSNVIRTYDSSLLTDGDDTTQRLSLSTPFLTVNEGIDETGTIASVSVGAGDYLENLLSCYIVADDVVDNKTIDIRVTEGSGDTITYTNTPSLTVDKAPQAHYSGAELDGVGTITAQPYAPVGLGIPHFRIRAGDTDTLNGTTDWKWALDISGTMDAGTVFRIRFEVEENAGTGSSKTFKLQCRVNAGAWTDVGSQDLTPNTPIITIESLQYTDLDATTNILSGSTETFDPGVGRSDIVTTPAITLDLEHTEYEWTVMILSRYDDFQELQQNDTIGLRLVETGGTELDFYNTPTFTVNIPDYYIGGCFVESPQAVGPFVDTDGNLYLLMEHSSTTTPTDNNTPIVVKSTDGGKTWFEQDGAGRPTSVSSDFESGDAQLVGDTLHVTQHKGSSVRYHSFNVSTHSTNPDEWVVVDEVVITGISETDQATAMTVMSDGDIWCFYRRTEGAYEELYYKRRNGTWGSELQLDTEGNVNQTWVVAVMGDNDLTHIGYQEITGGGVWHKSLSAAGTLSARESLTAAGGLVTNYSKSLTKPIYWDDSGDEKIMVCYQKAGPDGKVYHRIITNDGTPGSEVQAADVRVNNAQGGSSMLTAQLCGDGVGDAFLVYSDEATENLWIAKYTSGSWGVDEELIDAIFIDQIQCQYITHSSGNGGAEVVAIAGEWNLGHSGDDGYNWYDEEIIVAGGTVQSGAVLEGVGTLAAKAGLSLSSKTALEGVGTLDAVAKLLHEAQIQLNGIGNIVAFPTVTSGVEVKSGAELDGIGSVTVQAKLSVKSTAALDGAGTLGIVAQILQEAQIQLDGAGNIIAVGTIEGQVQSGAELDGVGSITINAKLDAKAQTSVSGVGSIIAVPSVSKISRTELDGIGTLITTAQTAQNAQAQLNGIGSVTTTAKVAYNAQTELDGAGDITALPSLEGQIFGKVQLDGASSIVTGAKVDYSGIASFDGEGTIVVAPRLTKFSCAKLDGEGTLVISALIEHGGFAAFTGEGKITAFPTVTTGGTVTSGAQLDGTGSIVPFAKMAFLAGVQLDGIGTLLLVATIVYATQANLFVNIKDRELDVTSILGRSSVTVKER